MSSKKEKIVATNFGHPGIMGPSSVKLLKISDLHIHRYDDESEDGYQRNLIEMWVNLLVRIWCPALCGVLNVVLRPDASYWIVDGQQRATAMGLQGIEKAICCVTPVDGKLATEAWLFKGFNKDRKTIPPLHMYRVAIQYGLPEAIVVRDAVEEIGYRVVGHGRNKGRGVIACVNKALVLARRDPTIFKKGLRAAAEVCGGRAIDNRILNGLCMLEEYFQRYEWPRGTSIESINDPENIKIWKAAGPDMLIRRMIEATTSRDANNSGRPQANGLIRTLNDDKRGRGPGKARPILHEIIPPHIVLARHKAAVMTDKRPALNY